MFLFLKKTKSDFWYCKIHFPYQPASFYGILVN